MNDMQSMARRIERTDGIVLVLMAALRGVIETNPAAQAVAQHAAERLLTHMLNATATNSEWTVQGMQEAQDYLFGRQSLP